MVRPEPETGMGYLFHYDQWLRPNPLQPGYRSVEATAADVILRLRTLCSGLNHRFWSDDLSLLDETIFRPQAVVSHAQITDIHLLALATSTVAASRPSTVPFP
jgi:hypothetical protein